MIAFNASKASFTMHIYTGLLPGLWLHTVQLFIPAYRSGHLDAAYSRVGSVLLMQAVDGESFRMWKRGRR